MDNYFEKKMERLNSGDSKIIFRTGRKTACSTERVEGLSKRTNAIILYDTLPAYCISKVLVMESGEIIYEKVFVSLRPLPTVSFKDNWMKELDSEVAGNSKDTQRNQPKTKKPIIKNGEIRGWTTVHPARGDRHRLWSNTIVTCSVERRRTFPSSRAREEDRKSSPIEKHFKPICSRMTSTTHSATIRRR